MSAGNPLDVKSMLTRLIDILKMNRSRPLFTTLTTAGGPLNNRKWASPPFADTWLLLRDIEIGGERNRGMYILKSRGMAHSNQIREFLLTDKGIDLLDVYVGPSGVLTGSARLAQEAQEKGTEVAYQQETELKKRNLESKQKALKAQIASLHAQFKSEEEELKRLLTGKGPQ